MFSQTHYRRLGDSGLLVSPIGLGTVKLGRNTDVKYPSSFSLPDDAAIKRLLGEALDLGINLIDTAPAYGTSEIRLGALLEQLEKRNRFIICTKAGEQYVGGHSTYDFSSDAIRASVEQSLRHLKTDYLDIVLIHCDDNDEEVLRDSDAIETLMKMKQAGTIRAVGASTKSIGAAMIAIEHTDIAMLAYDATDTSMSSVMETARQRGKGVLVKKGLASGHATDPTESLKFVLGAPWVSSVIVGTINPAHLRDNVNAALQVC